MLPDPIIIGPLSISYYGLMVATGVLAALALFSFTAPRRGISPSAARDFCFWMILSGLVGSRLAYIFFHWPEFGGQISAMAAYWRGGLMFQGGVLAAMALSPLVLKAYGLKFWNAADIMAPSLALGQAFGRIGCLAVGCCFGRPAPSGSSWGIVFPEGSLAPAGLRLWPTQIFEASGLFVLALILVWTLHAWRIGPDIPPQTAGERPQSPPAAVRPGRTAALYLFGSGILRLILEAFRGDYRGQPVFLDLPPTSVTALAAAIIGLILLSVRRNKAAAK